MAILDLITIGDIQIATVDADPTSGGIAAPIGSMAIFNSGGTSTAFYTKSGTSNTAWTLSQASNANLATIASLTPGNGAVIIGNGTTWQALTGTALQSAIGLAIGTNVQAYSANLATIAGLAQGTNNVILSNGTNWTSSTISHATLSDTTLTGLASGNILYYNGTKFVNAAPGATSGVQPYSAQLAAVAGLATTANFVVQGNGSALVSALLNLSQLGDVTVSAPANNQILKYNGTKWINAAYSEVLNFTDLADVTITTPATGNVVYYNGSLWVNAAPGATSGVQAYNANLTTISGLSQGTNNVIVSNGTTWGSAVLSGTQVTAGYTGTSYTGTSTAGIATSLSGIDAALTTINTNVGNKQPLNANLTTIAGLTPGTNDVLVGNGSVWTSAILSGTQVTAGYTGTSYTGTSTAGIATSLSGIDTALTTINTNVGNKQPLNANLTTISGLTPGTAGNVLVSNGTAWTSGVLNYAQLGDVSLTSLTTGNITYYNGTKWVNAAPGSTSGVQPYNTQLTTLAGLTPTNNGFIVGNGSAFVVQTGDTARHSLGLGTADSPTFASLTSTGTLTVSNGTIVRGSAGGVSLFGDAGTNTITVGGATSTVLIQGNLTVNGTAATISTTNLVVSDKLITLNSGGVADSGNGAGFEIQENSIITAYFKTGASTPTTNTWDLKSPDSQILSLDQSALTAGRTFTFPDKSGTGVVSTTPFVNGQVPFISAGALVTENGTAAGNLAWDSTNHRLGIGTATPAQPLEVAGNVLVSGAGSTFQLNADANFKMVQAAGTTSNNTPLALQTIATATDTVTLIEARIMGRRTGGSAGAAGDSAVYVRTARVKNVGGTVTIANLQSDYTSEDQGAFNGTIIVSGTNIVIQVTGATNNNMSWGVTSKVQSL